MLSSEIIIDPSHYYPLSPKYFETVIYTQPHEYIEHHHYITDSQYGFMKGHSTVFTAVELIDRTTTTLDNNKIPFTIYIDLYKAFDMINQYILLAKLDHYGIRSTALVLLKDFTLLIEDNTV